jgi:hypothetical protein
VKDENYIRRERRYGSFSRSVAIPLPVVAAKAEADFEDGVLTLTLPKAEEISPRRSRSRPSSPVANKVRSETRLPTKPGRLVHGYAHARRRIHTYIPTGIRPIAASISPNVSLSVHATSGVTG